MSKLSAREYLNQIEDIKLLIREKEYELRQIRERTQSISSSATDSERVQSSGNQHRLEDAVIKMIDMEQKLTNDIFTWSDLRDMIVKQIEGLPDLKLRTVLYAKYVNGKTLEEICVDMEYSYRQIKRLHGKALKVFEEQYFPLMNGKNKKEWPD